MNRFLPLLIGVVLITTSCTKQPPVQNWPEPTVTKAVSFQVYTEKDYSDPSFDNSLAEVRFGLAVLNLKNNRTTLLWDTTFNFKQLKLYPQLAQRIWIDKTVQHLQSSELLHVTKSVRYNINGYMSLQASGEGVTSSSTLVSVSL